MQSPSFQPSNLQRQPNALPMQTQVLDSINQVGSAQWNALVQDGNPFLSHEFLSALERHQCVGERTGWLPRHVVCAADNGQLLGAAPLYLKDNSYGEFVFDWSWAEAYHRHGLAYYPKLVSAIPFTPATGPRLLVAADADRASVVAALIEQTYEYARRHKLSSIHWLFTTPQDTDALLERHFMRRLGCQFHWQNPGYRDFSDFLDTLTAKKRKNIKRERRLVQDADLELSILSGAELSTAPWQLIHRFYCDTFYRLGGIATLTLPFFEDLAEKLSERLVLVLARKEHRTVAAAISWQSDTTLYGRHWGCLAEFDSLHFEACYYQGIEHCIEKGLKNFEPGAQGEHKIYRGFLPTLTQSAHWLAHSGFRAAVADFLQRETPAVQAYARDLKQHSPYRAVQ